MISGGSVTNAASASITGGDHGVDLVSSGTVVNSGRIAATAPAGRGIVLALAGSVSNAASGSISGADAGVYIAGPGTVANDGTIAATAASGRGIVVSGGVVTNAASASIIGGADGVYLHGTGATLVNSGSIAGTAAGADAVLMAAGGGSRLIVNPGAAFTGTIDGGNAIGAGAVSTLELAPGNGHIGTLDGPAIVDFGAIQFDDGARWLLGGGTAELATGQTISGFAVGDTIALASFATTGSLYNTGALMLSGPGGMATLDLPGSFATGDFLVHNSGGDSLITLAPPCFAAGTRLLTASGEAAVESLAPGDTLVTMSGRLRPVRWIGHRHIEPARHPRPRDTHPMRITANAIAPGVPHRDLLVSPDHALFLDGVLVPARYLCNSATIRQEALAEVSYYHIELATHDILLAEGLPAESYLDTGNRGAFANGGGAVLAHADFARRVWAAAACAPLVLGGPKLVRVKRHLLDRAAALGHAQTGEPDFHLLADGAPVWPEIDRDLHRFTLPRPPATLRLVSRDAVPAELVAGSADTRCLGVAVERLMVNGCEIRPGDPRRGAGWHPPEADWQWTDGDAELHCAGVRRIEVKLRPLLRYWRRPRGAMAADRMPA